MRVRVISTVPGWTPAICGTHLRLTVTGRGGSSPNPFRDPLQCPQRPHRLPGPRGDDRGVAAPTFLTDLTVRKAEAAAPFSGGRLYLGAGASALEVLVVDAKVAPTSTDLRTLWKARRANRAAPVLVVALHGDLASICGPSGEQPPALRGIDIGQAERICRAALGQADRHAAVRFLTDVLPAVDPEDNPLPGIRNSGFLATHELVHGAPALEGWAAAEKRGRAVLASRGEARLKALGYQVQAHDQMTSILRAGPGGADRKLAVAVLLRQGETPELQAQRFNGLSPVSYALAVAERENIPYVIVEQGAKLRLYPVKLGVGVGRRGPTETYIEVHADLLRDDQAAYLWMLFASESLADGGSLDRLIGESRRFAGELAERLRERIYAEAVPTLAQGLADARRIRKPSPQDLADTYEMAMTVLFRLLFIAYAEDKDLLPYEWNALYKARSLKQKAIDLAKRQGEEGQFSEADDLWQELRLLFRAVEKGHAEWGVPEYDGGLFASDGKATRVGPLLDDPKLSLPNTVMGPVLRGVLIINGKEGWGPVDFRSLGVREFGTIYEGLLESELSVADTDLTVDDKGFYRPCQAGEEPVVRKSRVYIHNRSGARKASGSYFTKEFAVDHLLDKALEPALDDHLARIDALKDDNAAADALFDFRVADISMGSAHFLVAAVDRIERKFRGYLAGRRLSGVQAELATLRASALEELGRLGLADALGDKIEDTQLLRRLIARRCIYGVDLNPISVNLARLSIWIHTFVPGLPLSLLDHNLVVGNSLVGIGRLDELIPDDAKGLPLFRNIAEKLLGPAVEPLRKLARITDAKASEVRNARKALADARAAVAPAEALFDIATAARLNEEKLDIPLHDWAKASVAIVDSRQHKAARKALADLPPFHFPIAFPEVFLRERSGFDVILGNPPWEEATIEEHAFWARYAPGLRGLGQREQEAEKAKMRERHPELTTLLAQRTKEMESLRAALSTGPYPGMGTGDPDLYKAFCWRFWRLIAEDGGWLGVVLPRSAFNAKGSTEFRIEILPGADPLDATMLVNNREWVFPEVHPQYSIALIGSRRRLSAGSSVRLRGPFASRERFDRGVACPPAVFAPDDVLGWTDTASFPLLPTEESLEVFTQLRKAPRLDLDDGQSWRARPMREFDATNDKGLMDVVSKACPKGFWPVFKGESFDIFTPDTGKYYAWAEPKKALAAIQEKRLNAGRMARSAWSEFPFAWRNDPDTLPCLRPRIAFRDVTRATDSRTVRLSLLPPRIFVVNQAPYFLWPRGDVSDEAFLLGVLSSLSLDWYARRFVETHVNFHVLNPFPIPRPDRGSKRWHRTVALTGRLACPDNRFSDWAKAVGVECGPLEEGEKWDMLCELDAVVAHLYGLEEQHLRHIFETFHEGWGPGTTANHWTLGDYDDRLERTLGHFRRWGAKAK